VVEIYTIGLGLFPSLPDACDVSGHADGVSVEMSAASTSISVFHSVSSALHKLWYSSLLLSLKCTVSKFPCLSVSLLGLILTLIWIVIIRCRCGGLTTTPVSLR